MDLLSSLLLIPFALPMVLGFVNMCCCGRDCSGCTNAPAQFQVVIVNVVEGSCGDCTECNATWTLDYSTTSIVGGSGCYYLYTNAGASFCGATGQAVQIQHGITLGNYFVRVDCFGHHGFGGSWLAVCGWGDSFGASQPDCSAYSSTAIPSDSSVYCDNTDPMGTCEITAL